MSSRNILLLIVMAVVLVSAIVYFRKPAEPSSSVSEASNIDVSEGEQSEASPSASRYIEFSPQKLASTADSRRVLFFYASWCGECRPVDEELKQRITEIPGDVTVIRVNYNDPKTDQDEKDLAEKYGITYQHTFVQIDGEGNEIKKWNGGDVNKILSTIQ